MERTEWTQLSHLVDYLLMLTCLPVRPESASMLHTTVCARPAPRRGWRRTNRRIGELLICLLPSIVANPTRVSPLMFKSPDGKVVRVPVISMLVYYFAYTKNVRAFPPGFRMVSGNPHRRTSNLPELDPEKSHWTAVDRTTDVLEQRSLGFNCMKKDASGEPSLFKHRMPHKDYIDSTCENIRVEIAMRPCWNGREIDSIDHKSHVAFLSEILDGKCPEGYPIELPTLFFEVSYATNGFRGLPGKFIFSDGDDTGNPLSSNSILPSH
jgi:Domain of unknown function (DUF1996)